MKVPAALRGSCTVPHTEASKNKSTASQSAREQASELQALADTAAGFLIGRRAGGNGLREPGAESQLSLAEPRM